MLTLSFLLSFIAWILQGAYLPKIALLAFLPFIALCIIKCTLVRTLWLSAAVGFLVDLGSDDPIGLHALNYTLTAFFFWRFRKPFAADQPLHVSILTALTSSVSTVLQLMLLFLFDRRVPFDGKWLLLDVLGMPLIDALYGFVWVSAPLALFSALRKLWMIFWLKRKNLSPTSP